MGELISADIFARLLRYFHLSYRNLTTTKNNMKSSFHVICVEMLKNLACCILVNIISLQFLITWFLVSGCFTV